MDPKIIHTTTCFHCGDACDTSVSEQEKYFCCNGCKSVYNLLNQSGLCSYYELNEHPGFSQKVTVRQDKFAFLEDPQIRQKLVQYSDESQTRVTFYLPQIHCSSCLWLLENLRTLNDGIIRSEVKFMEKEVYIVFDPRKITLRAVVELLAHIGYEPHISLNDVEGKKLKNIERSRIYKVGIAGFCFGNIMMMSFPEYLSMTGVAAFKYGHIFRYLNLLLSLPVFFYSANEFYRTAWNGLKNKYLNIDFPVSAAIVITFMRSIYEIATNTGPGYLDSMCGIVFFMLVGRIFQNKTYRFLSFDRDYQSFFPIAISVLKVGKEVPTQIQDIKKNDVIKIYDHELIPCDAILSKGNASIDYSFVTGESLPQVRKPGDIVYAGGKQVGGAIELVAVKEVSQGYLTNLWNRDAFANKEKGANRSNYIDFFGKHFTILVLAIAFVASVYWASLGQYQTMLNVLTTVLIVACPCALLLSASFTHGNILRYLSKNEFYVRDASVIGSMGKATHLVFDKTGTLTENNTIKVRWEGAVLDEQMCVYIASLMSQSTHPLSKAIVNYVGENYSRPTKHFVNHAGLGVEGWMDEHHIRIGSAAFLQQVESSEESSIVYVVVDDQMKGRFFIWNQYRYGIAELINSLKSSYKISIISGDNDAELANLTTTIGKDVEMRFQQDPVDKLKYVRHLQEDLHEQVMMIGDGLNDAGALMQANVGIAVTENTNNFTPACDGILRASKITYVKSFLQFSKASKTVVMLTFVISAIYNVIGLKFAVMGQLKPVIAAILMPMSTISIIFLTYTLTEYFAWKYRLKKI